MKNKGFTLVELMGVIVLLSILVVIAVPAITGILKQSKDKLYETQLKTIETAAKNWASEEANLSKLPSSGNCITITLKTLKEGGFVDLDIKNPKTDKPFEDGLAIKISKTNKKLSFEANPSDISGCTLKS